MKGAGDGGVLAFNAALRRGLLRDRLNVIPPRLQVLFDPSYLCYRSEYFVVEVRYEDGGLAAVGVYGEYLCEA